MPFLAASLQMEWSIIDDYIVVTIRRLGCDPWPKLCVYTVSLSSRYVIVHDSKPGRPASHLNVGKH
jgi:hypothetical protein